MKFFCFLLVLCSLSVFAQEKQARSNDQADKYVRIDGKVKEKGQIGDFFRYVDGNKCQITSNVDSYKVSQHPGDVAMVYYEKYGDLYFLANADKERPCPKANTKNFFQNVTKYSVTSSTKTDVVNFALNRYGTFHGWPNEGQPLVSAENIEDYSHNNCFGAKGKSYSSYVVFAISYRGYVLKVKGKEEGNSKWTDETYRSIKDFKEKNKVCQ